ncbi:MAG: tetratricopeptide repeat protein [Desulfuromonadales bacterium]
MKEKLLASAQKNIQKGQLAKAIKDYQKLVSVDGKDIRHRQKLAELLSRAKMIDEAITEYEAVAKHFSDTGFYLKAIAVYKQLQKLDASQPRFYQRLAELNEKQGLAGNALAEYRSLVSLYEKQNKHEEAVGVLEKMKRLDPENLSIRVKIAERFVDSGRPDQALTEFDDVCKVLEEKQDWPRLLKLYEIFLPLFPENVALKAGLAQTFIREGEVEKGMQWLKGLIKSHPDDISILATLALAYKETGDLENSRVTLNHFLKIDPTDLVMQEEHVRLLLRLERASEALEALEQVKEDFKEAAKTDVLKELYEGLFEALPKEPQVRATLKSLYEEAGEDDKLFALMSRDEEGSLADEALAAPTEEPPLALEEAGGLEELPGVELEDLVSDEIDEVVDLKALEDADLAEAVEDHVVEMELELDVVDEELELVAEGEKEGDDLEEAVVDLELDLEPVAELEEELEELVDEDEVAVESVSAPTVQSELEEAEFYLQQDLLDEAEQICQRLLTSDPSLEAALEKLGEIQSRRLLAAPAPAEEPEEGYFDLAAEIMDDGALDATEGMEGVDESDRFQFDGVFAEFKKGVDSQIGGEDAEAHYSLGIAYKEMGLLDDAIAEFEKTMKNPARFVDGITAKGICLAEKGSFENAEHTFKAGLANDGLDSEERISIYYELGLLYEVWGKPREAFECFKRVAAADSFFRNVSEKLSLLGQELGISGAAGNDDGAGKSKKDRISFV